MVKCLLKLTRLCVMPLFSNENFISRLMVSRWEVARVLPLRICPWRYSNMNSIRLFRVWFMHINDIVSMWQMKETNFDFFFFWDSAINLEVVWEDTSKLSFLYVHVMELFGKVLVHRGKRCSWHFPWYFRHFVSGLPASFSSRIKCIFIPLVGLRPLA